MAVSLDFSAFTTLERTTMLAAAKAELLRRITSGAVVTGSSSGQSFGMMKVTTEELTRMINALSDGLGYGSDEHFRIAPNFSRSR